MASFNKVILMGNLTRDPQLKYLPSQTPIVEFGVACNRRWKAPTGEDREEVTFVDCSSFRQDCRVDQPVFHQGQADLYRRSPEI